MWVWLRRVLRLGAIGVASFPAAAQVGDLTYPDHWESYSGNRDGEVALILYNAGIGSVLGQLPEKDCIVFSFHLKEPGPDGLPQSEEGKVIFDMDDAFGALIASSGAHDLGRLSVAGKRDLYIAAGENAELLGRALVDEAGKFGYSADFQVGRGALSEIYFQVLSPTREEQLLLGDQNVLRQLADAGDIATKVRQVDHWAYFPTQEAADAFAAWAVENGYSNVAVAEAAAAAADLPLVVRSSHEGTMLADDISRHTLAQFRRADELGGSYDGWETMVMR